jgi:hypothetical protein
VRKGYSVTVKSSVEHQAALRILEESGGRIMEHGTETNIALLITLLESETRGSQYMTAGHCYISDR